MRTALEGVNVDVPAALVNKVFLQKVKDLRRLAVQCNVPSELDNLCDPTPTTSQPRKMQGTLFIRG